MNSFWQEGVIWLLVGGAIAYLVRRIIAWRRRHKSCSECQLVKGISRPRDRSHTNNSAN